MTNSFGLGKRCGAILVGVALIGLAGCGYTSELLLPEHIESVHVPKVVNEIDITTEVTNRDRFKVYRPGLEVELRNSVIERFIFDGHLRVQSLENADAVLHLDLVDFKRDPLRYNNDDTIQEFRVEVAAAASFVDIKNNKTIWQTSRISGTGDYFLSGELARSEDTAVQEALEDLSRHIVEHILEVWS